MMVETGLVIFFMQHWGNTAAGSEGMALDLMVKGWVSIGNQMGDVGALYVIFISPL